MSKKKKRNFDLEEVHSLKMEGVKISRGAILKSVRRFYEMNESVIQEGARETRVLKMKRFYGRNRWKWPPQKHHNATTVHLINGYYGKEVVKHVPKDKIEIELGL